MFIAPVMLCSQFGLYVYFAYVSPRGPWRDEPGYTAHRVLSVALGTYLSVNGFIGTPTAGLDGGSDFAGLVLAAQLMWSLPTSLLVRTLRRQYLCVTIIHAGLAACMIRVYSSQAFFFLGVCETSNIFGAIADMYSSDHTRWERYISRRELLKLFFHACFTAFVVTFVSLRVVCFSMVICADLFKVRDTYTLVELRDAPLVPTFLALVIVSGIFHVSLFVMNLYHKCSPPALLQLV